MKIFERWWSMAQDGLMGRKEVLPTSILCLQGPFFQFTHVLHMFPVKCCALEGFCSFVLAEGLWIGSFCLFEFAAPYCPGFLNSHSVVILSPHNHLGTLHPGLEVLPRVDNCGSFFGSSCFGFSLVQRCLKVPNRPLPFEVQGPFNWKHMIDSQVGIGLKLQKVHCRTVTEAAIGHCCGRIGDGICFPWRPPSLEHWPERMCPVAGLPPLSLVMGMCLLQ